jgi:phage anti-repressor protein
MNQIIKTETIDFNALVSKSVTLSENIQSKMINILNKEFTEEQQRWYIANLYIYMNYHPTTDFPINLETVVKLVGFAHKKNAKRTLENNFTLNEDYKIILTKKVYDKKAAAPKRAADSPLKNLGGAGLNEEQIMLNIDTFKNMCMLVKTEKSKDIRKYYVKLENIYNKIIKEEIENTKNLLQQKTEELEQKDTEHKQDLKLSRQTMLLQKFDNKNCVYLCEIQSNLIKIGSSQDINTRKIDLKRVYGACTFLDIFECNSDFREIEQCILSTVRTNLYKEPINGHFSKEVVLLNENVFNYNQLVTIVRNTINTFINKEIESKKIELETKKIDLINNLLKENFTYEQIYKLINSNEIINIVQQNIQREIKQVKVADTVHKKGRKIQVINPDNLNVIVKIYDSMMFALRDPEHDYDKHSIQSAVKNNTIYKGYRWLFVEHGEDVNIVKDIQPTFNPTKREPTLSVIVRLNHDKTEIIETYSGITKIKNKYKISLPRLHKIINENKSFDNSYFIKITDCSQELLSKYTENNYIAKRTSTKASPIKMHNIITNEEIIYKSINDATIKFGSNEKTITDSIKNKTILNGYIFEYV